MAIGEDEVRQSIQIEVEEANAPACIHDGCHGDAGRPGNIFKRVIALVAIERIHLAADIGHKKILVSILIKVDRIDAHAGARRSVGAVGYTRGQGDLFKFARSFIQEEKVRHGIFGDKQVEQPVVVDVGRHHAKRLAGNGADARGHAYVGECAIAVVAI